MEREPVGEARLHTTPHPNSRPTTSPAGVLSQSNVVWVTCGAS